MSTENPPIVSPDQSTLLRDGWRALWGRYDNPVYRAERKGWSYLAMWRGIRLGCLPAAALLMLGLGALCTLPVWIDPSAWGEQSFDRLVLALVFASIGVWMAIELLRWIATLLATFLASTTIAAEVEGERLAILRSTLVTNRQIVLSKFSGVLGELRPLLRVVSLGRITVILGLFVLALVWIFVSAARSGISPAPSGLPPIPATPLPDLGLAGVSPLTLLLVSLDLLLLLISPLVWVLVLLLEPFFSTGMFTAIGVFASTLARTRASGLFNAAGIRVVYFVLSYLLSQLISSLLSFLMLPVLALTAAQPQAPQWLLTLTQDPTLALFFVLLTMLASMLVSLLWMGSVTLLSLNFAATRLEKLPYGL